MREDVYAIIREQFEKAKRHQAKQGRTVDMTIEEYVTLWSPYRIKTLGEKIDARRIKGYLSHPDNKPVTGWRDREDKASGVMTVHNAKIMQAWESKIMFAIRAGEKHTTDTLQKMRKPKSSRHRQNMRKPKSDAHRAAMKQAAKDRWEAVRAASST